MLLELLLSMVIVSFMIVVVAIIFTGALRDWKVKDPKLLLQQEGTIAMNKIERQLKKAGSIYYAGDKSVAFTPLSLAAPEADAYTVSLWRFDEGSGTTANDETGTNNGTLKAPGEPDWVGSDNGESEDALRFDGNDDYVDCGNDSAFKISNNLTLGAWLQPNSSASGNGAIIYMDTAYRLYLNDSGYLVGGIYYSGDWHDVISNRTVPRNGSTWTHTVLTYDKDEETGEELKLYINGHNAAAANHTHSIKTSSDNLYIGYDGTNNQYPFNGVIDEVRVSDDVRRTRIFWQGNPEDKPTLEVNGISHQLFHECNTDTFLINYYDEDYDELTDVSTQANRNFIKIVKVLLGLEKDSQKFSLENVITLREEKSEIVEDVVAYWKMDEDLWDGTPDEVKDISGNNNHGTAYGGANTVDGKIDRCGNLDGTSGYVAIQNLHYDTAGEIPELTVCAWFNTSFSGGGYNSNWAFVDFDRSEYYNFYVRGDDGRLEFSTRASSGGIHDMVANTVVNDGKWHFACAVYDGTDKIIYLDGEQDAISPNPHSGLNLGRGPTRYGFIGDGSEATAFNGNRNNLYYEGKIDEVRIYHRALLGNEIKELIGFIDSEASDFSGTYDDTVWETDHIELSHP
jgi:hypothetical protein